MVKTIYLFLFRTLNSIPKANLVPKVDEVLANE